MKRPIAVVLAIAAALTGTAAAIYLGCAVIGYLARRSERVRLAPARAQRWTAGSFSAPVNGLAARWEVRRPRIGPGRHFEILLRLRNVGTETLGLQVFNVPAVEAELTDANAALVAPTGELPPSARAGIGWEALAPGSDLAVPISGRADAPAVAAHLEAGTRRWVLRPGRYALHAAYTSRWFGEPEAIWKKARATPWSGRIDVPPVELEVLGRAPAGGRGAGRSNP